MVLQESKFTSFLKAIDIFSYVPVPQAYPVSTSKSRTGSVIVILLLLAYIAYDLYLFIMKSVPTINAIQTSFVNQGPGVFPKFAFGFKKINYESQKQFIVDLTDSPISFNFTIGVAKSQNLDVLEDTSNMFQAKVQICSPGSWPTQLTIQGSDNLLCVQLTPDQIDSINTKYGKVIINQNGDILTQIQESSGQLLLTLLNLKVISSQFDFTNTDDNQLVLYVNQAVGYDYATASEVQLPFPQGIQFWQFPLDFLNLKVLKYYTKTTQFVIDPNYLTRWTQKVVNFTRITYFQEYQFRNNPKFLLASIDFLSSSTMNLIEVHFEAFYQNIAEVNSNVGLVVAIGIIFFLGYNRNKFNNRNPDWERFDSVLHQKMILEMQPTKSQKIEAEKDKQKVENDEQSENSQI